MVYILISLPLPAAGLPESFSPVPKRGESALMEFYCEITGVSLKKTPPHKNPPPIRYKNLLGGGFLYGRFRRRRKFWGFEAEIIDFIKGNRVLEVQNFPPAAR